MEYSYDPWGNIEYHLDDSLTEEEATIFTALCPLTYRGYNYDFTTGLYYLQSRYYNPEWGRFLNCDDAAILLATQGETHNANLFAYCNNNPINRVDYTGYNSKELTAEDGFVYGIVALASLAYEFEIRGTTWLLNSYLHSTVNLEENNIIKIKFVATTQQNSTSATRYHFYVEVGTIKNWKKYQSTNLQSIETAKGLFAVDEGIDLLTILGIPIISVAVNPLLGAGMWFVKKGISSAVDSQQQKYDLINKCIVEAEKYHGVLSNDFMAYISDIHKETYQVSILPEFNSNSLVCIDETEGLCFTSEQYPMELVRLP